jgi:hypothetical protein
MMEKHEQTNPQISIWKEIMKIGVEINEIETKRSIKRINKRKS